MNPESTTETYAAMRLDINTRRWAGVPFYLRAGKRLGRRVTEIAVVFKRAPQHLFAESQTSRVRPERRRDPRAARRGRHHPVRLQGPGAGMQVRDVTMDFGYGHAFTEASPEAYERLILDVLLGEPPLFPRHEEVELSWKILDPIEEYWATQGQPEPYRPGTWGPARPTSCWPATDAPGDGHDRRTARHHHSAVSKKLVNLREEGGVVALGRVLTLVIATSPGGEEEAIEAANDACREHPMRVIVVSTDAESRPTATPGSTPRSASAATPAPARSSCCAPTANRRATRSAWSWPCCCRMRRSWPGGRARPRRARASPRSAGSRSAGSRMPRRARPAGLRCTTLGALHARRHRLRLDPADPVAGPARRGAGPAAVRAGHRGRGHGSDRLALDHAARRLAARCSWTRPSTSSSRSPTPAPASTACGSSAPAAPSSSTARLPNVATLTQPGQPTHDVSLPRRSLRDCLAEELRRLDPDELFGEVITSGIGAARRPQDGRRSPCSDQ